MSALTPTLSFDGAAEGAAGMASPLPAAPPRPKRKRNGDLACGCRPYHLYGEEGFRLCPQGRRLYKAITSRNHDPSTPKGAAAARAYSEHIGLHEEGGVEW